MDRELDRGRLGDHIDRLYRAACGLTGSRLAADDLVQETFARVLSRPRRLRSHDDVGYLLRVMRNVFLDQRQGQLRQRVELLPTDEIERHEDRAATNPQAAVETREVFAVVAGLRDEFRDVVVAVDLVGLSYQEAAKALRIPQGTVMSRLYRGREQIARRFP